MAAWPVDGMDVLAVEEAARRAVDRIRGGGGPCFLELRTYRFRAHSMYDPERYRDKAEVARWRERDPIELLAARMTEAGELAAERPGGDDRRARRPRSTERSRRPRRRRLEPVEDLTRFVLTEPED